MRYTLSLAIKEDLDDIAGWIAQDSPRRAIKMLHELRAEFSRIAQQPELYQLRPEIGDDARLVVFGRYVILFWIDVSVVRFERIVFGGRDLPVIFSVIRQ